MTAPQVSRSALTEVMELFRTLRRQDQMTGIRNSGIALDVCLIIYERAAMNGLTAMSVDMISEASGYTGPTVRLVLKRLTEAGTVQPSTRMGKTQFYGLTARGFDTADIEAALARLMAEGSIDESRLAEHYVAERIGKGFGPLRIRGELREKGLADELIDHHLEPLKDAWAGVLATVHDRRFGNEPPTDRADLGRRARFLEQRGFPTDSIRRFLRRHD